jgi:deazaflavin-dependent oxidoreductase (nitroreductase family)
MATERASAPADVNGRVSGGGHTWRHRSKEIPMSTETSRPPKTPPSWFIHTAWRLHRVLHRVSGGRFLWIPSEKRHWGALHLTAVGRKSGQERSVILGYLDDGPNITLLAMNGWEEGHPDWWLNLEANPEATVRLAGRPARRMRAVTVTGAERDRLWRLWAAAEKDLDGHAGLRSTETPVMVLEPIGDPE